MSIVTGKENMYKKPLMNVEEEKRCLSLVIYPVLSLELCIVGYSETVCILVSLFLLSH